MSKNVSFSYLSEDFVLKMKSFAVGAQSILPVNWINFIYLRNSLRNSQIYYQFVKNSWKQTRKYWFGRIVKQQERNFGVRVYQVKFCVS